MKFYLAPLEGITGHVYRNALEKYFPGTDRYFTPFIAPDQNKVLRTKEKRDVLSENNRVGELIPQILTNNAEHFLQTARVLREMGYEEVNLNLGCPSGTVVSRRRGSGLLAYPEELDRLLEQIFDGTDMRVSVKTRVGRDDSDDAFELMEIYRKYPLSELIIHPRTQKDFYRGEPDQELFGRLLESTGRQADAEAAGSIRDDRENIAASQENPGGTVKLASGGVVFPVISKSADEVNPSGRTYGFPVCYNGNLLTRKDYDDFTARFPQVGAVMLGRGVIANPGLIHQIKTGQPTDKKVLRKFHDEVLQGYRDVFGEDKNALFRMKEMWIYMIHLFSDHDKYAKKLRKAQNLAEYGCAVDALFGERELLPDGPVRWELPAR